MPGSKYLMDLAVYRLSEADYYRQRTAFIEERLYPNDDPLTAETRRKLKAKDPNSDAFIVDHCENLYGGAWCYNEIIGFIDLHVFGTQVRGEYWRSGEKRIIRTRKKLFKFQTWKLGGEMDLPMNGTNAEIFAVIREYVRRCELELKGRHVDTRSLDLLGPFVDWNSFLRQSADLGAAGSLPSRSPTGGTA